MVHKKTNLLSVIYPVKYDNYKRLTRDELLYISIYDTGELKMGIKIKSIRVFLVLFLAAFSLAESRLLGYVFEYCYNHYPEVYPRCQNGGCMSPEEYFTNCIMHNCHHHAGGVFDHDCAKNVS